MKSTAFSSVLVFVWVFSLSPLSSAQQTQDKPPAQTQEKPVESTEEAPKKEEKKKKKKKRKIRYYARMKDKITVIPFLEIPATGFFLHHNLTDEEVEEIRQSRNQGSTEEKEEKKDLADVLGANDDKTLGYSHKLIFSAGSRVAYGNLGLSFKWKLPFDKKGQEDKPNVEFLDLRTQYYLPMFAFDVYYQRYQGFFIKDFTILGDSQELDPEIVNRPELEMVNYGGIATYVHHYKYYSFRAPFDLADRQKRSAASFLANFAWGYSRIHDPSGLIPEELHEEFGDFSTFNNARLNSFTLGAGMGGTFVLPQTHIFANALGLLGVGGQLATYDLEQGQREKFLTGFSMNFRFSGGYNGDRWLGGVSYFLQRSGFHVDDFGITWDVAHLVAFAGMRL